MNINGKNDINKDNIDYQVDDLYEGEENYEILPENSATKSDLSFKLIVIGDSGVGKTSLSLRAVKNSFNSETQSTIGFEFLNMLVKTHDKVISLQVWDTCGQEIYKSIVTKFYKRASLAILVYSITDKKSFDNLDLWLEEIKTHASPDVKIALVGNKSDLKNERQVTKEEALNYKLKRNIDLIFESSAKHGDNSKNIFLDSAKLLYKEYKSFSKKNRLTFTKIEGEGGSYEVYSHPFALNAKLPSKRRARKKKKDGDEDDYDPYDDNQAGSCTKC